MSFEALQERLTALQDTHAQLRTLIEKLAAHGSDDAAAASEIEIDGAVGVGELSSEISQILREEEDELELLKEEAEDLRGGRPGSEAEHHKARIREGADRLDKELKRCKVDFRRAQLAAHQSLEQAQRRERELFLQSYSQPVSEAGSPTSAPSEKPHELPSRQAQYAQRQHQQQLQAQQQQSSLSEGDQQQVGASSNVTMALRQTHELIAAELAKSEFAHQTLTESTAALAQLDESYGSLDTMLASSRELLGTLLKSQKSDTWYLQTALYMLLATFAWLLYRRIFYHLVWLAIWWPLKLVVGGTFKAVGLVGAGRGTGDTGGLVGESTASVRMEADAVPTIQVGKDKATGKTEVPLEEVDEDSMVEQVGKIVDDSPEGQEVTADEEAVPNPKKRMWEEPTQSEEEVRARDEL